MCKFKSNAETRYLLCVSLLRLSTTCVRPGSDFCAGARSSRQSRPSGVVEHVAPTPSMRRPCGGVCSVAWRGKQLPGLLASAAAPRGRISGPMRDDQRCARIERPGSCAPLADRPPPRLETDAAAAALVGSRTRFRAKSGLQKARRPPPEALRPGSRPENGPSETETDPTPYASRGQPLTRTALPSQNRCANASPSQRLTAALAPQPPRTLCTPLHSFAR